jgi:hypothetical protein
METNKEYLSRLLPLLKKPIPHQWRVQSYSKNKPVATVMAYVDARDVQDVLDTYCEYGWQRKHQMLNDRLYCSLGIQMPDGTIQWKEDCGTESNQDAEKGQASDAFKRAGVNWGIGRFLYDMKIQYVDTNVKKEGNNHPNCVDKQGKQIYDLTTYINNLNPNAPQAPKASVIVPELSTDDKVRNMTGRSNPELAQSVADAVLACKSRQDIIDLVAHPDYKQYESNEKFQKLVKSEIAKYPKPQKSA